MLSLAITYYTSTIWGQRERTFALKALKVLMDKTLTMNKQRAPVARRTTVPWTVLQNGSPGRKMILPLCSALMRHLETSWIQLWTPQYLSNKCILQQDPRGAIKIFKELEHLKELTKVRLFRMEKGRIAWLWSICIYSWWGIVKKLETDSQWCPKVKKQMSQMQDTLFKCKKKIFFIIRMIKHKNMLPRTLCSFRDIQALTRSGMRICSRWPCCEHGNETRLSPHVASSFGYSLILRLYGLRSRK